MNLQYGDAVFQALMDGSPVPSAVNDDTGKITYLNTAFVETFGYTQLDIPTIDEWWPLAYPNSIYRQQIQEAWFARLHEMNETGELFAPLEVEIRIKNGESRTVIGAASLITGGTNPLFLVTLIDITERKKAELALKKSEESLNLALSGADMTMWNFVLKTGKVDLCARWYQLLGYENLAFDLDVSSWKKYVHKNDWHTLELRFTEHIKGESQNFHSEFRLRHKDGHWVWVQSRGKIIERDENGDALRIAGINFDISGRKRLAAEGADLLQKIEKLILNLDTDQYKENIHSSENKIDLLTDRQKKVMELVALGFTSLEISSQLSISHATAVTHRRNLMKKLNLHSTAEITRFAIQNKLISK